ncbi:MAG: DUF4333 domain-containing protein [Actinomycetota bacterium]|nr:DUF4333 domain-containing protein [Actinomycetota bacterium]
MKFARTAAIAAACLSVGLLAGCAKSLDSTQVSDAIDTSLTDQFEGDFTVTCPSDIPAEAGNVFTCDVSNATDGSTATVEVTQNDADGNVTWEVVSTG